MIRMFKNILKKVTLKLDQFMYKNKDFVIVSNNCWGAEIYKSLGVKYNTPFVGLYIYGPDFIKLLEKFDYYIKQELSFVERSKWVNSPVTYPIGIVDDIEIHFLHYNDSNEAIDKWNRRLERMSRTTDLNKYYFKIDDRDLSDQNIILKFHELPFKNKISFGIKCLNLKNHIQIKENENNQTVPDGVKLYKYCFRYVDVLKWVDSGIITNNLYSRIKSVANMGS